MRSGPQQGKTSTDSANVYQKTVVLGPILGYELCTKNPNTHKARNVAQLVECFTSSMQEGLRVGCTELKILTKNDT